jgi:hypothetical protein
MQRASRTALLGAVVGAAVSLCGIAQASTLSVVTPTGSTDVSHNPVNASATITTGAGVVDITLSNLQTNILAADQLLSDVFFTLSGTTSNPTYPSNHAQTQNTVLVASGGTFTSSTNTVAWALSENLGVIHLDGLGSTATVPAATCNQPACTIIGPPTAPAGTTYSNANSSIAGNGPHNPFIFETANFEIDVTGVTAGTTISNIVFSFGTASGDNITGVPSPVPLPASVPLFGSGLALLGWLGRRRKRAITATA